MTVENRKIQNIEQRKTRFQFYSRGTVTDMTSDTKFCSVPACRYYGKTAKI